MADQPDFGKLDVTDFTVGAMLRTGLALRRAVQGAATLEAAANIIVRYMYDHCVARDGARSIALARFYKTHQYGALEPALQRFVALQLGERSPRSDLRCLTLLATAGDEPEWNARRSSRGHQAIPLASAEAIRAAPMIMRLIEEFGIDVDSLVSSVQPPSRGTDSRTYDVFHVEEALGSPYIPAQREFVEKYDIASVVGFGGLLRSGELFALILFSRDPISVRSATRFRTIALDVRSSLFAFDEARTFRKEERTSADGAS